MIKARSEITAFFMQKIPLSKDDKISQIAESFLIWKMAFMNPVFTRTINKLIGLHGEQPLLFQYINRAIKNYRFWAFIIFSRYETRGVDQCFSLWFRGDAKNFHVKFYEHDKNGETTKLLRTCSGEDFIFFQADLVVGTEYIISVELLLSQGSYFVLSETQEPVTERLG